eukprot:1196294-Prorocentrum_minimum.AAC.12
MEHATKEPTSWGSGAYCTLVAPAMRCRSPSSTLCHCAFAYGEVAAAPTTRSVWPSTGVPTSVIPSCNTPAEPQRAAQ